MLSITGHQNDLTSPMKKKDWAFNAHCSDGSTNWLFSTAVIAGPSNGYWGGAGGCEPTQEEENSIFDNEWVSVIADTICTMVHAIPIRDMEKRCFMILSVMPAGLSTTGATVACPFEESWDSSQEACALDMNDFKLTTSGNTANY